MITMHGLTLLAATAAGKGMSMMNIAELVGGLVFFMFGMRVMSQALEKMAGGRLERMLKQTSASCWAPESPLRCSPVPPPPSCWSVL